MSTLKTFMDTTILSDSTKTPIVTMAHLVAFSAGLIAFYFLIDERRRKTLFK